MIELLSNFLEDGDGEHICDGIGCRQKATYRVEGLSVLLLCGDCLKVCQTEVMLRAAEYDDSFRWAGEAVEDFRARMDRYLSRGITLDELRRIHGGL